MLSLDLLLGVLLIITTTSLGSLAVLFFKKEQMLDYSDILSFCAGVMLFSSIEMLNESKLHSGELVAITSLVVGVIVLFFIEKLIPHIHMAINKTTISHSKKKVALLVGSICIHNIPEGFAVASAFAHSVGLGWLVTLSIAAQDAPEGLLVSTPLTCYGVECKRSIYLGILSGVIEGFFAIVGYMFLDLLPNLTPATLGFSSGAMLYVTLVELLPDAFKNNPRNAALSFVFGMLIALGIAAFLHF